MKMKQKHIFLSEKKKTKPERLTLLLIPETAKQPYKLNISTFSIKAIATSLAILLVVTIGIGIAFYGARSEIQAVNDLKQDNLQKTEAINLLDEEIKQIEKQKEQIEQKQSEIKKLMGITDDAANEINVSAGGKGGADLKSQNRLALDTEVFNRVQDIKTYLSRQEQELDELLAQVDNEAEYFRSIPNQWPVTGEITSPYGWRKSPFGGKSKSFHDGIDIANDVGTIIIAAADGRVTFSGWRAVYGRTVVIDHGYGFTSMYGHNSALLVEVGDQVKKGDKIAKLGNTGRSTGPHLHFTITKWGDTQDPLIYLP